MESSAMAGILEGTGTFRTFVKHPNEIQEKPDKLGQEYEKIHENHEKI